jgi:hypothetical protein
LLTSLVGGLFGGYLKKVLIGFLSLSPIALAQKVEKISNDLRAI